MPILLAADPDFRPHARGPWGTWRRFARGEPGPVLHWARARHGRALALKRMAFPPRLLALALHLDPQARPEPALADLLRALRAAGEPGLDRPLRLEDPGLEAALLEGALG